MHEKSLVVALGISLVVGCGGSSIKNGNEPEQEQPQAGSGGSSGSGAQAGTSNGAHAGQGGQGGSAQPGIGGGCTKLCVPTASFVLSSPVSAEELRRGRLEACRNGDAECFEGTVPPLGGGNTVSFDGAQTWSGPSAFSEDEWQTLRFSWGGLEAAPPFADGDRFVLTLESNDGSRTLLDHVVQFETVTDCAGACLNAFFDLSDEPRGDAGAGGQAGAGSEAGAGGQAGGR